MGEKTTLDYETRSEKPSRGKRFGRHVALFTLEFWLCSVLLVMGGSLLHSGNWINATTFNSLVELAMGCNGIGFLFAIAAIIFGEGQTGSLFLLLHPLTAFFVPSLMFG